MKLTKKQKIYAGIAAFLFLLIITNPSVTAFKTYRGLNTYKGLKRPLNLFVYSIYQEDEFDEDGDFIKDGDKYLAVFGNFWDVSPMMVINTPDSLKKSNAERLSVSEFAQLIKSKYPEYKHIDNRELVDKIIAKYPMYKENVNLSSN